MLQVGSFMPVLTAQSDVIIKTSSLISLVAPPPPYDIRRKEGLDVWLLAPGDRYFLHDRDSRPALPGLPFQIYADSFEDQLAADAKAASPLNFDHDNKENNSTFLELEETPNSADEMTVIPASQYRRTSEESCASRHHPSVSDAFYELRHGSSPYGLGGSDGTHDEQKYPVGRDSASVAMSTLAPGKHLPRASSIDDQADDIDSVLGLRSSNTAADIDSVLGSSTSI